jgi:hypothetical protein
VCWGTAHRTVRCTTGQCLVCQDRTAQTSHSRVCQGAVHYNSPDCPVCQWSNGYSLQRSTAKACDRWTVHAELERRVRGAPDSEQNLSGGTPDCPVPQEDKLSNDRLSQNPNGWVTWRRTEKCPMAHRTVRCAHWQQPSPMACRWLRVINTPNHHNSKHPSLLKFSFNTRASAFTPRHKSKDQSLSKSQTHSNHLVTCESVCSCSFALLCLDRFLPSSFLFLSDL